MEKIRKFFKVYVDELSNKVTWPKTDELQSQTITVLVASLVIAFVIFLMDISFNTALSFFYQLFE